VDGGAAQTKDLSASATAQDLVPWSPSNTQGLSSASRTIRVTGSVATCYLDGFFVMDNDKTAGTHVWNCGHGGATSKDLNLVAPGYVSRWTGYLAKYAIPQTVIVTVSYNDWRLGASNSTVDPAHNLTELTTLITTINTIPGGSTPLPSIILAMEPRCDTTTLQANFYGGTDGWDEYVANAYALERTYDNVSVFDFGRILPPPYESGDPHDIWHFDYVHPNIKGHALWADKLVDYLAS
jgi:lysophospholipase L1-like esterase